MNDMAGNLFGTIFRVMTFGESHGVAVGVVVDGCPSNVPISKEDFQTDLSKRQGFEIKQKENKNDFSLKTTRKENDECKILSGLYKGTTLGTPIAIIVENKNVNTTNYETLKDVYRPGHGDFTYEKKFSRSMPTGGGRASGRETVGRVLAGTVARKLLQTIANKKNTSFITIETRLKEIAGYKISSIAHNEKEIPENILKCIKEIIKDGDSIGAVLECTIHNVPTGLGEPVFGKLEAELSKAVMSIGGIKGIEFGSGFSSSTLLGSENNDITKEHAGGVFAGISSGEDIHFSIALKPIPSIKKEQMAYKKDGSITKINIDGRHDSCLFPRIVPVIEAMCYITIADATLLQMRNTILT